MLAILMMRLASRHPRAFVFIVMPLSLRPCSDLAELVIDFARPAFAVVAQLGGIGFWPVNISNSLSVYCLVWTSKGSIDVFTCLRVYVFGTGLWQYRKPNPVEPTAAGYGACKRRCGATCGNYPRISAPPCQAAPSQFRLPNWPDHSQCRLPQPRNPLQRKQCYQQNQN